MIHDKRVLLANYALKYEGDWKKIAVALKNHEQVQIQPIEENYLTIFDEEYPSCFLQLRFPPWVIFYEGNLDLLKEDAMTIVGSRDVNAYGSAVTKMCASELAKKYVIVSGLARGVDGIAHRCAIQAGGKTIGVIGCGLDYPYPKRNLQIRSEMKRNHLVLSEYPKGTKPNSWHFPWRNRLLACIGNAIVVTQATYRSGTMCTVKEGLELSRDIYTVPWPIFDPNGTGCNLLLQQGAMMISSLETLKGL